MSATTIPMLSPLWTSSSTISLNSLDSVAVPVTYVRKPSGVSTDRTDRTSVFASSLRTSSSVLVITTGRSAAWPSLDTGPSFVR
jgi:hypothetical protein